MTVENSEIKNFFTNQTILLTGGTGFLGKILTEKLLRECWDLKKILILVRPKKGKTLEERYKDFFDFKCFDLIESKKSDLTKKVVFVNGDCEKSLLGLSTNNLDLLKRETTVVIHAAANVRFDQSLKKASCYVRATRDLLELSKEMLNLKVFIYVSTAFSNICHPIKEEVYKPPIEAENLLKLVDSFDSDVLEAITPQILGKYPNTYIYSKSVSENVVAKAAQYFPTVIVRPAIVTNSADEPFSGWIDNVYGPIGIQLGVALGIIRVLLCKLDFTAHMVPVDYLCNCILATAWKVGQNKNNNNNSVTVYNYVGSTRNPITWGNFIDYSNALYWKIFSTSIIWYKFVKVTENKTWYYIYQFFLHTVPAYVIDVGLFCVGKKRIAVKLYRKIDEQFDSISYFSTRLWQFDNNNICHLWNDMTDSDKKMFKFDLENLNWAHYVFESGVGIKRYVLKESDKNDSVAERKQKIFFVVHHVFLLLFWYLVYKIFLFILSLFL